MCDNNKEDINMVVESGDNRDKENMDKKSLNEMHDNTQNALQQMKYKFETMTDQLLSKNLMGNVISSIDELEKNISDMMNNTDSKTPDK